MKLEPNRSLLQDHWCRNSILFTEFNNLKQKKVCFNSSLVFENLSILFFLSSWVRRGDRPSALSWNRQCPILSFETGGSITTGESLAATYLASPRHETTRMMSSSCSWRHHWRHQWRHRRAPKLFCIGDLWWGKIAAWWRCCCRCCWWHALNL